MELLAVKILVTPLMMLAVSLAARRWGSFVGGVLSGLPLTSGPISVYFAIEQGQAFTQQAAAGSLAGLAAIMASYLAAGLASRRLAATPTILPMLAAFAAVSLLLLRLAGPSLAALVALALAATILLLWPAGPARAATPISRLGLLVRMATSTALVLLVTGLAGALGPSVAGALAPTPVIAWPLIYFAHRDGGRRDALDALRGNASGGLGVVAFYLIVSHALSAWGPWLTFPAAFAAAVAPTLVFMAAPALAGRSHALGPRPEARQGSKDFFS